MNIIALALLGSRARGDNEDGSDVDLLAVTNAPVKPTRRIENDLTISFHPQAEMIRHARGGDLFVLHIVSEAKVIFDPGGMFPAISGAFHYKESYAREIKRASDVGWLLVRHSAEFTDARLFNDRAAWVGRSILIARAADRRRPIFSARGLAKFAGSEDVLNVVKGKGRSTIEADLVEALKRLLIQFGTPEPAEACTIDERRLAFARERNTTGLSIIEILLK